MEVDINIAIDITKVIVIILTWEIAKIVYDKIKKKNKVRSVKNV